MIDTQILSQQQRQWALALVVWTAMATLGVADGREITISPDHPATWWTGNYDAVERYVQWNATESTLEGHVVYRDRQAGTSTSQCFVQSFTVHFPKVRLDAREGRLYLRDKNGREITIGHLSPSIVAGRVELEPNVELSIHRHNGHLDAALELAND